VIPVDNPDLTIQYGAGGGTGGTGSGSISGVIKDEADSSLLNGVEVTLFAMDAGLFQDTTENGAFSFEDVPAGNWQIVAFLDGYYPEMVYLQLAESEDLVQDIAMSAEGAVGTGEGFMVSGTLRDSKSAAPISGAAISMMADTGYYLGVPEPGVFEDVDASTGSGSGNAGAPTKDPLSMPFYYDPQYQETTSAADGSFEFAKPVIGYGLYFNFSASGYLSGSWYENIDGRTEDLEVELTMEPIIPTDISGVVKNQDGSPIDGAWVEFIFSGGFGGGGPVAMDGTAIPPMTDLDMIAEAGKDLRDEFGTPPPPAVPPGDATGANGEPQGWEDWAEGPMAGAPGAGGGTDGSGGLDNSMMQRFRFEHQQGDHSSSDVAAFDGYLAMATDENGEFKFEDVPAGPYWVVVSAYRHIPFNAEYVAEEDPAQNIEEYVLEEVPVGSVEGTVIDEETLEPVEDVLVNATQPNVDPFTYTDANGHYRIDNIPVGDWIISAFKSGYLTASQDTPITEDGVVTINLVIAKYEAPPVDLLLFGGSVLDGSKAWDSDGNSNPDAGISGATLVFTPVQPELGGYYRHITSGSEGVFSVDLINNSDYNLLIQAPDFQDLYTRIWTDASWPKMDFSIWPVKGGPGGGGGGVILPPPGGGGTEPGGVPGDDGREDDPSGGGTVPPDGGPGGDPIPM